MPRRYLALSCVALSTLTLEVLLIRIFDVILTSNLGYMVITCTMFALGMGGIYEVLRPTHAGRATERSLARLSALLAGGIVLVLPACQLLPFDFDLLPIRPVSQGAAFFAMYLALALPFFISGLLLSRLFSAYAREIQRLYFFDLAGAALGSLLVVPMLPPLGAGRVVLIAGAVALVAAALFATERRTRGVAGVGVVLLLAFAILGPRAVLDLRYHHNKRGVSTAIDEGRREFSRWDPISKIDVIDEPESGRKHIAYDGGSQSSHVYPFDGDFVALRANLWSTLEQHFWNRGVLASHYLRRDSGHRALIIGAAGGQEVKAALLMGAGHVDGVEMVGTVVELGKERYRDYNGGLMNEPRVRVINAEGCSFLRQSRATYDVVQIFSNYTTSSLASGSGAMTAAYLQTVEAYREYFTRLADDGILHINHHVYPRMITTAAVAWRSLGRTDFRRHVFVAERDGENDTLPTMLIKMSPWTPAEVAELEAFVSREANESYTYAVVENPLDSAHSKLSDEFYAGGAYGALDAHVPYRITPITDDRPFFNFMRKKLARLEVDDRLFVSRSIAAFLNTQLRASVPMDLVHLLVPGVLALLCALLFVVVPLFASPIGRTPWRGRAPTLCYFSCLGFGFIIVELVAIQLLMKLIGYPLYTVTLVICTMLIAAAVGSYTSRWVLGPEQRRWWWPFAATVGLGTAVFLAQGWIIDAALTQTLPVRMLVAALTISPAAYFMGMPFPLGVLALERQPPGAIAWAWGMNGLMTVVGGLASVVLALWIGFRLTFLVGVGSYLLAWAAFAMLRRRSAEAA